MHYVYVLQSGDKFYIGFSSDLRSRVASHNRGDNPSTRGRVWNLVYYEAYKSRKFAHHREQVLKNNGRSRRILMDRIKQSLQDE